MSPAAVKARPKTIMAVKATAAIAVCTVRNIIVISTEAIVRLGINGTTIQHEQGACKDDY
jgi:hypothetical protein